MAAVSEMGEIDDVHSKDEGGTVLNGDIGDIDDNHSESSQDTKTITIDKNKNDYQKSNEQVAMDVDNEDDSEISETNIDKKISEEEDNEEEEEAKNDKNDCSNNKTNKQNDISDKDEVVHEIIDDDEDEECEDEDEDEDEDDGDDHNEGDDEREDETIRNNLNNGINKSGDEPIELNDSGGDDGDVMIIEDTNISKENGASSVNNKKRHNSDELEVIELDSTPVKKKIDIKQLPTRRSIRNINKQKSYVENERDTSTPQSSEESDIEEVLPQDPLAVGNDKIEVSRRNHKHSNNSSTNSSTIVVKDTKRLVEIAAKSNNSHSGNKKEPTLVIIDTNSILSGRGPVPVSKNQSSTSTSLSSSSQHQTQSYPTILPMALPAQGMYPPNMRATITPITMNTSSTSSPSPSISISSTSIKQQTPINTAAASSLAPLLPTLTDDMFVVEAPSFIVPYVYEKPPVADFKEFLKEFEKKLKTDDEQNDDKDTKNDDDKNDNKTTKSVSDDDEFKILDDDSDDKKPYSYFESPLGKFFIDIGFNLVQEFVQSDLLKQQKRKRDREGGNNPTTNKTINSLMKNLEFSKEHNEPFKIPMKKCEFCHFKTESFLAMAHHLETPHTKNYVYKCNFCTYEVRNPHDILFHMEAEHMIRGRLERAPAFHQCPNCPFEDNQKGKLSRHLATCMKKFKPEKNLEPPLEWEPPAKIPRVPKQRQGLNVSAYQAMKTSQLQGRGRPSLGTNIKGPQQSSQQQQQQQQQQLMRPSNMVYKQPTMSGGSVLVPTNYQLSGNQVFQQHNQSKNKSMHQPSISITPLPRASTNPNPNMTSKPGDTSSKNSFVICEICDGYIKDLEQLRNHMQWIHKVKIHPKMIYNRPPLNCQKCQFRFFTDQGLERHLLGSHGLVTSSMQDAANKSKDAGRCPVCGRVYQWKLLNHVARDHNMTLKPAHLSYKCTVCTATFGMYKQFENHVYSAHSVVARRVMDKKNSSSSSSSSTSNNNSKNDQLMKPLKINDEITIIPQPAKSITSAGTSKESNPATSATGSTNCRNNNPSTSKSR